MKITLIINPVASSVNKRNLIVIQKALSSDHELEVLETSRKGQATRLAYKAAKSKSNLIIAHGGDGTINEVVNGILDQDVAVVPLPGGSTNVFARSLGYPNEAIAATAAMLEAIAADSYKMGSIGLADGRAFLFHVGAGFDAAVVEKVEEKGPLKKWVGHPLFIASTFATWLKGVDRKNPWFSIKLSDGSTIPEAQLAVALNCNPYTYLGNKPLDLAPEATLDTKLSLIALTKLSVGNLVPAAFQALRKSEGINDSEKVRHLKNVDTATITGYKPFPYQLDGEFLEPVNQLLLESKERAVKFLIPIEKK